MTARLDLIAHGPSAATRATRFPDDEPLDASVLSGLEALRGRLRAYTHVLTAPARAARETAAALGFDPEVETALRDCDYGRWRGLASKEVARREPDAFAAWLGEPAATPHDGESIAVVIERIGGWLARLLTWDGATLAITHAPVVRAAIINALGASPLAFWRIDVAPLSFAQLSGVNGRWNLVSLGKLGIAAGSNPPGSASVSPSPGQS
jgi:broad specificity phosphatase PhoE